MFKYKKKSIIALLIAAILCVSGCGSSQSSSRDSKKDWRSPYLKINNKKNPSSLTGSFFLLSLQKCSIVILYMQKMSV